ncbi:hypothetical protein NPIL_485141 [Nephila pilipes]|uniref:Uncharacterized protein n=1 Tax=Nephila pilipes TaxID=299642 RepID=A0A8X6PKD5_NEPPI|nr:hypothetical protein NPIL_485141 [Nephila pilipes]
MLSDSSRIIFPGECRTESAQVAYGVSLILAGQKCLWACYAAGNRGTSQRDYVRPPSRDGCADLRRMRRKNVGEWCFLLWECTSVKTVLQVNCFGVLMIVVVSSLVSLVWSTDHDSGFLFIDKNKFIHKKLPRKESLSELLIIFPSPFLPTFSIPCESFKERNSVLGRFASVSSHAEKRE